MIYTADGGYIPVQGVIQPTGCITPYVQHYKGQPYLHIPTQIHRVPHPCQAAF